MIKLAVSESSEVGINFVRIKKLNKIMIYTNTDERDEHFTLFFTLNDIIIAWKRDHICQFKEN